MIVYFSDRMKKFFCSMAVYIFIQPFLFGLYAQNFEDSIQEKEVSGSRLNFHRH